MAALTNILFQAVCLGRDCSNSFQCQNSACRRSVPQFKLQSTSAANQLTLSPPMFPTLSAFVPHLMLISSINETRATPSKQAELPTVTLAEIEAAEKKDEKGSTRDKVIENTDTASLCNFEKDCQLTSSSGSYADVPLKASSEDLEKRIFDLSTQQVSWTGAQSIR